MSSLRDSMPPGFGVVPPTSTLWGNFLDPALEREFEKENFALGIQRFARFSVPLSLAAFLCYGLHDALVIPEVRDRALAIRFLFFGPIAALLTLFVFKNNRFERRGTIEVKGKGAMQTHLLMRRRELSAQREALFPEAVG